MAEVAFRTLCEFVNTDMYNVEDFNIDTLNQYDYICMSTLTWGKGAVPSEWIETKFLDTLNSIDRKRVIVIGTGDDVYGKGYNAATEMLASYAQQKHNVIGKLKMLLKPKSEEDIARIRRISEALINKP